MFILNFAVIVLSLISNSNRDIFSQQSQILLLLKYAEGRKDINSAGFRNYSQFEEDGILLFLLGTLGIKNRKVVEIGSGFGLENMSTNLIINHGFQGWLFDGSSYNVRLANFFYSRKKECKLVAPNVMKTWITTENVNKILEEAGVVGEIDILSLDIDGNELYIWESLSIISPRICVIETADFIPSELSISSPYVANRNVWTENMEMLDFRSGSLKAFCQLANRKGYTFVGTHRHGFNAFFVRNDLMTDVIPVATIEEAHDNPWTRKGQVQRWPKVSKLDWIDISF
jgi:hypothetical protein